MADGHEMVEQAHEINVADGAGAVTGDDALADARSEVRPSSSRDVETLETATFKALTQDLEGQILALRERLGELMVDIDEIKPTGSSADATTIVPLPGRAAKPLPPEPSPPETTIPESAGLEPVPPGDQAMNGQPADDVADALIEHRLAEVDRDYQRLARELSSPAVRPRWLGEDEPEQEPASGQEPEPAPEQEPEPIDAMQAKVDAGASEVASPALILPSPARIAVANRPFALQLIGFYRRELLDDFIERSPLPSEVYVREERFRGRPWFVLIHSLHRDQAAAQQATEALPNELGELDLWIRRLPVETELDVIKTSDDQS
ncbi:MAG: hypothetical protein VBE63_01310 [Lamprobacter sp.]|uniref:hypothetical protein n=1 Tax=Lamprobacter sp. TaxID=3100796 RepID=UPI002B256DBC|nr:hypothetical protein [Lamprobacter sp.]MEA3638564.1 hypothetical protein [Lamprobacter sp.]